MNLITRITILIALLLSTQSSISKIYFSESAEKIGKSGLAFTLKQLDSSENFNVIKTQKVGVARSINQYFSPSGKYLGLYMKSSG